MKKDILLTDDVLQRDTSSTHQSRYWLPSLSVSKY